MKVRFQNLQENLRANIWSRLERGEVTGKGLARHAGFQQAHLSNFLNRKRGLSLQAMDRLLDLLHIDVLHLAGLSDVVRYQAAAAGEEATEGVALVSLEAAASVARFSNDDIQDTVAYSRSLLRRLKFRSDSNRRDWTRFAAVKLDARAAEGMAPLLSAEAVVLIDRYNNAPPLQASDPSLYAVIDGSHCLIRRVTSAPGALILRPLTESLVSPVRLVRIPVGKRAGNLIIGRVRHVAVEV